MEIYDPKTGHTKMVVDECVDPYRPNCRGCDYSFDPSLFDGGCTRGTKYEGKHCKSEPVNVYEVVTQVMQHIGSHCR